MIILDINIENFAFFKSKRDSPVTANRNCPLILSISFEPMQVEAMNIDVGRLLSSIENVQSSPNSAGQAGRDSALTSRFKKLPQSLVAKRPDHNAFMGKRKLSTNY